MRVSDPRPLLDDLYFPECLREHEGGLWFSDMFAGTVHRMPWDDPSARTTVFATDDLCGGIGWLPGGDLLVCSMEKRLLLAVDASGAPRVHADLSVHFEHPINDMLVLPDGRALVSGYGYDVDHGAAPERVALAVVEPDGTHRLDANRLLFPNGIDVLSPGRIAVAETFAEQVTTIPLDGDGGLGTATAHARFGDGDGPDGISADGEGGLWVACAFGERVVHLDTGGREDAELRIPGLGVFDCLAAASGDRLVIAVSGHDEEYGRRHRTGSLLEARITT
ncbi:hypothetical protein E1264_19575 [Actinomadura sp. KC216]|uniref:SMP-30/gluconolactonase/LRE family protein n=1 Tax=Actinomadura sp. KC216 TaxID=2530370 RepID=UPI00104ECBEF|nr:SMP-30/gluconolactonase/LRE family protein [Actinomadura sp. KC216]TDB85919.1 hypothetical protein E1264_19575 [Actinomadura sp. KC216]